MERFGSLLSVGRLWSDNPWARASEGRFQEELIVTAIDDRPYFIVTEQPDGSFSYDGYLYQLWQILARELGLRYRIQPLLEGRYGYQDENGTWTGMIGELKSGRADVALSWLTYHEDRAAVAEFLDAVPVERADYAFYVARSSETVRQLGSDIFVSLMRPLDASVWWTLLTTLLIISTVLHVSVRFNHSRAETPRTVAEMSWSRCLLFSFMAMVGQGWWSTPRSLAARVVSLSSWVLGILIYSSYTANLISHLALTTVSKPIGSLREFSEQPDWILAIEPGLGILNDWRVSNNSFERELYWRTRTGQEYIELDMMGENISLIVQDHVMTYVAINRLYFSVGAEACDLVPLLDNMASTTNTYLAVSKRHTELKKILNRMLLKLSQAGIVMRLRNTWVKTGNNVCKSTRNFRSLYLGDLLAIFTLIPAGIAFGMCILALELTFEKLWGLQNFNIPSWVRKL